MAAGGEREEAPSSADEKGAEVGLGGHCAGHRAAFGGTHVDLKVLGDGMDIGARGAPLNVMDQ